MGAAFGSAGRAGAGVSSIHRLDKKGAISGAAHVGKAYTFSLLRTVGTPLLWYHRATISPPHPHHASPLPVLGLFGVAKTLWPGNIVNKLSMVSRREFKMRLA